jgi:phage shock protein PspC (stress-responsive transcriptional regulator)
MKQMYSIDLAGMLFHINHDAYEALKDYLASVEGQFPKKEGKEITQEIETRLAELFSGKINEQKQVITINDVKEAIEIIGKPEDFLSGEPEESNDEKSKNSGKRLYRDPENKVLGGVCSGLAAYFKVDIMLVRIIFILFTLIFASGLLIYLILWIITPEARTYRQKREMYGKKFNFEHFKRKAQSEYEDIKNNFNL